MRENTCRVFFIFRTLHNAQKACLNFVNRHIGLKSLYRECELDMIRQAYFFEALPEIVLC